MNRASIQCFSLAICAGLLTSAAAQAALVAAQADVSSIAPCPSFCGGPGAVFGSDSDGGVGSFSAAASLTNAQGNGLAFASLTGSGLLPVLRSGAFSNPNARIGSSATGLQSYDYVGTTPTTISLAINFHGSAQAPVASDAAARASVVVMKSNDFFFTTDFGTLVFEALSPEELVGTSQLNIPANVGSQNLSDAISIALSPGDRIGVWGSVQTSGTRGGVADALSTLSLQFSSTAGLVPTTGVPSPSSGVLLVIALVALGVRRLKS